ncbi:hypothetical protein CGS46_07005 [Faecalibacterium langellae]|uniref:Bacterial repeat domain-containing protein n=1 Tax=Faecalibacterium langellae TaxID=3435293 RepID=A0A2A6ZBV0_9FIRM|nr:InlB B-repeat-containing protein [Faecalibacterium prausnitzii]PDX58843.1 hypothetical protein CGS46_07005 [Faecalibacterium prausnitzii]
MKQGKLIRRAVSAALAGCMMFTLSAPALAESTDALMQLSIGSYRSSSLLSEENSFPAITVNGTKVTEENIGSILGAGKLSYNEDTKTLESSESIKGDLTIDAKGVNIELHGNSGEAAVGGKLTVTNAQDVKVTAQSYVAVLGDVEISCDGKVEITSEESPTVAGNVTVKRASTVAISGEWNGYHIVRGDVTIECPVPVTIQNKGTGGMASSIVYSGGKYVYSDTEGGMPVDPSSTPINAEANAVYITPVAARTITLTNATVDVPDNKAYAGQTVTVKADARAGYQFVRWEGNVALSSMNSQEATFTMPDEDVVLTARYKKLFTITVNQGTYTVNGTAAAEAVKGDQIVATAGSAPAGQKFSHWEVTGVDGLTEEQLKNETLGFTMPRGEVTLKAVFKTLHKIGVKFSTADKDTAIEGETVTIKADDRPGYVFDRWEVNNGDVAVLDKNAEETTFVMPDAPVTAVAKYKKLLGITVNSGKAYVEDTETDAALKGKLVVIKADEIEGKRFDHWEIVSKNVILNDLNAPETMFTMPETAVEITAVYNDLNAITVHNGTADVEKAVIGETVKIKADSREGYVFDRWEVNYGDVVVDDKNAEETTFTMPDSMVVLTARYKALQSITLENGKAYAGGEEITTAKKGTEVTIKAESREGYVFDRWEVNYGNVTLEDAKKAETTFTMPAESISLKAVYNTIHSIHTTFCTADPASAIVGTEITVTAETREGYEFDGWAVSDGVELYDEDGLTAKFTMPDDDVTIEAKYKQYHTITMVGGKGTAYDADGKEITSAVVGDKITIVANDRDSHEFNRWEINPDNVILEDPNADETAFIMPDEPVSVEAKYKHLQSITMNHGTAYDEDFSETDIAKAKQTITIKAEDRYADGLVFDHWTVDTDNVTLADEYGEKTTFEMVNGAVELTAHYKARVTVFSVPAKFEEGIGEHSDETWEKVGETATITAKIDEETFPGMEFDYWEVIPTDLDIGDIHSPTISFEVPECEVKLVAHWKASGMNPIVDPDEDLDPGFGVETESSDGGAGGAGAAIAGVAIGGAAVWGGYEITTRVILHSLLPEGAAIPANRGQLALLVWNTAGRPEPAGAPAFADVADADMAKAAQWCTEQGIMDAKGDRFEPEGWTPKFKVIEVWNKAFPKQ